MVKAAKYRVLAAALRQNGCVVRQGKGDHEIWTCGCGASHRVVLTQTTNISPGLVRQTIQRLPCLPEGWLK
jgi:hypothetical protein